MQHRYCILGYLRYQCVCMLLQRYRKWKICINSTLNKLHHCHCYLQRIEENTIICLQKKKDFSRLPFSNIRCVSPFHIVFYLWQPPVPPHIPPSANVQDLWGSLHWCPQCLSSASSCHHHKSGVRISIYSVKNNK